MFECGGSRATIIKFYHKSANVINLQPSGSRRSSVAFARCCGAMSELDFKAMMIAERRKLKADHAAASAAGAMACAPSSAAPELSTRADLRGAPLTRFRVGHAATPVWYVPDFLSSQAERELLRDISAVPGGWVQLSQRRLRTFGGTPHPSGIVPEALPPCMAAVAARLAVAAPALFGATRWDGDRGSTTGHRRKKHTASQSQQPDHVLLNEYRHGQGIGRHKDGPMYEPAVAVINMCAPALIHFEREPAAETATAAAEGRGGSAAKSSVVRGESGVASAGDHTAEHQSLVLMPRSLLIFSDAAYRDWTHHIETHAVDVVDGASCVNAELAGMVPGQRLERGARRMSLTIRTVALPKVEEDFTEEGREEARRRQEWFANSVNEGSPPQWTSGGSAKTVV